MNKVTPFLWLHDKNAEQAAEFYLSIFADAKRLNEVRSNGVGPWNEREVIMVQLELMGQQLTLFNGGPQFKLSEAFSFWISCKDQAEIDFYWDKLKDGGKEVQCGWLQDKFGLFWQVVPEKIGELIKPPKGMAAMMKMVKLDIAALEAAGRE